MVFSVNQVRQLYVVKSVVGTAAAPATVGATAAEGAISMNQNKEKDLLWFTYKGVDGLTRSDIIPMKNILNYTVLTGADDVYKLKQKTVKLDADVNEGNPIAGEDYILRISISPYLGMSDEDVYIKYGAVHATAAMAEKPGLFYKKLAVSLFKNFSREPGKLFDFIINGKTITSVTNVNGVETLNDASGAITVDDTYADGVTIREVEQDWHLGTMPVTNVNFIVTPTTVTYNGDDVTWGTVTAADSDVTIKNGKKVADLEYFCMGERGDQYRNVGWPNVIPTKYLVDSTQSYDIMTIHYAYIGDNESPQKSEKDIVLVGSNADITKLKTQLTTLMG